jgi:proline-specific peptidase
LTRYLCTLDPWPDYLLEAFQNLNQRVYGTMWGASEFHVTGTLAKWDVTDRLKEIRLPTLILGGRHDEVTPSQAEALRRGITGSRLVIFEKSSHLAFAEEPDAYRSTVEDFLALTERSLRR